ncbi:MBL fold metallo-hydrolase [Lactobacillus sp. ESL0791]|uniref:MBL fold metallo-hydrolase n=1 Tax=Lactobacillus sp. ESL0791 TaxID=2983234 RepID=UPI0023F8185A|nr:MBL fold metallo-hydrolase [Lactobacillus sp. ESL0791]MDF7639363.1 MBL fold metallo-hydrolase [Lactobacillus sp. ESL0791]
MINNIYASVNKVEKNLYCLKEVDSINRYLIIGKKYALLFDCGYGYIDFTSQIKEITNLPLIVVNSHGDPDHALGSYLFEHVYIHIADYNSLLAIDNDSAMKKMTIDYRLKKLPGLKEKMSIESYIKPNLSKTEFSFVKDGDSFDLGCLHAHIIHIPGHTPGSIALYIPENGWLFTGDSVDYHNIFYQTGLGHHAPLKTYVSSMKKLNELKDKFSCIYPAHGQYPIPTDAITEMIEGVYDLLKNYKNDKLEPSMGGMAYAHHYKHFYLLYQKDVLNEALLHGIEDKK